jgi:hypothetical protein
VISKFRSQQLIELPLRVESALHELSEKMPEIPLRVELAFQHQSSGTSFSERSRSSTLLRVQKSKSQPLCEKSLAQVQLGFEDNLFSRTPYFHGFFNLTVP